MGAPFKPAVVWLETGLTPILRPDAYIYDPLGNMFVGAANGNTLLLLPPQQANSRKQLPGLY